MVKVEIGPNRKHKGNVERSAIVRERIEDYLKASGGKRGREDYEARRLEFIGYAVRTANRLGMRTWKESGTKKVEHGAIDSLKVLFGEKSAWTNHKDERGAFKRSGVNSAWVLDIWEATLDHLVREDPFLKEIERENEQREVQRELTQRTEEDELERLNSEPGPRVFKIADTAPISVRLLDAYLNRDDDAIMRIAVELEHVENGH